jgi:hypothetical protein
MDRREQTGNITSSETPLMEIGITHGTTSQQNPDAGITDGNQQTPAQPRNGRLQTLTRAKAASNQIRPENQNKHEVQRRAHKVVTYIPETMCAASALPIETLISCIAKLCTQKPMVLRPL